MRLASSEPNTPCGQTTSKAGRQCELGLPQGGPALFRLLLPPPPLDLLRELLVLFRHLHEAMLPQALRPGPVSLRRLIASLLGIILGRHQLHGLEMIVTSL